MEYKHIILAIDLHPDCDESLLDKGLSIAKRNNAKLTLVHAVEHLNTYGAGFAYPVVSDIESELFDEAKKNLSTVANKMKISEQDTVIEIGAPRSVVLDVAEKLNADLIIVGSHGRHGLQLLLGSTANGVLHNAKCDVLAVRVKDEG